MSEDIEGTGFTIKDHRSSLKSEEEAKADDEIKEGAKAKAEAKETEASSEKAAPEFEMNFSTLVMSLAASAFYSLGDVADPETGQKHENLPAVKQTIDTLLILKEKTKNNLDAEEDKLLEQLIYELQMKYVAKKPKE